MFSSTLLTINLRSARILPLPADLKLGHTPIKMTPATIVKLLICHQVFFFISGNTKKKFSRSIYLRICRP